MTSKSDARIRSLVTTGAAAAGWAVLGLLACPACADQPRIDRIETFLTNQVLIHFNTEADRNYALQVSTSPALSNGVPVGTWTNLYVPPTLPFPSHYIVADTRTTPQRFYRLRVTP
jgi:hypothetical protein